ncbi:hypothetical protein CTI12_AA468710 [Artemisia annua]|uniref:Protein PHLOEM PROTEIN 2-LIKE A10 n=1 Tax=Artemisia annua TaxID=35608 RepID=A0A2U1LNB0_ARTAN|nr:hypothetical protein CTI12_AA468710 [Artemisia annua]
MLAKSFQFTPRKKKWVILLALCGLSSYGMYKVYNLPSVSRNRKRLAKLLGALIAITEMVSDSSETLSLVSRDLKEFLASEQDQVPNSLKQLSKIAVSNEVSKTLSGVSEAVTLGVIQGYNVDEIEKVEDSSFKDHVMDKLMSKSGTGFVSVVVGSFARNLVLGFNSNRNYESGLTRWVGVLSTDESKLVIGDLIKTFVSTAVATYLDRATSVNVYDGMFSGLTNPKHHKDVKDIVVVKTLSGVSEAVTLGVIQGYNVDEIEKVEDSSFKDHVMDKLMSKSGTGFVSVVVGSFARNLVLGFNSNRNYESGLTRWVGVLSTDESKLVIGDLIKTFVSTAVATYLDRATSVNVYDGMFSGLTNPKHHKDVKDIVVYLCNGAVETFVKTSHQVLTS